MAEDPPVLPVAGGEAFDFSDQPAVPLDDGAMLQSLAPVGDDPSLNYPPAEEARICFPFLNHGQCARGSLCKFRHLDQDHPDAIADRVRTGYTNRIPGQGHGYVNPATRDSVTGASQKPYDRWIS